MMSSIFCFVVATYASDPTEKKKTQSAQKELRDANQLLCRRATAEVSYGGSALLCLRGESARKLPPNRSRKAFPFAAVVVCLSGRRRNQGAVIRITLWAGQSVGLLPPVRSSVGIILTFGIVDDTGGGLNLSLRNIYIFNGNA